MNQVVGPKGRFSPTLQHLLFMDVEIKAQETKRTRTKSHGPGESQPGCESSSKLPLPLRSRAFSAPLTPTSTFLAFPSKAWLPQPSWNAGTLRRRLTVSEVLYLRGKGDFAEVALLDVAVHVLLCFRRLDEGEEPGRECGDEDGEHPEVQHVPQLQDVLPRPFQPELLTLGPHHPCRGAHGGHTSGCTAGPREAVRAHAHNAPSAEHQSPDRLAHQAQSTEEEAPTTGTTPSTNWHSGKYPPTHTHVGPVVPPLRQTGEGRREERCQGVNRVCPMRLLEARKTHLHESTRVPYQTPVVTGETVPE